MTKQIRAGIVALLLSLSAGAAENVGMLTELHGAVQLASAETADWTSATLMKAVSVGDKLRTPAGATVTVVFFANGKREQLQAGCLAVVQTAGCKVETGPQPNTTTVLTRGRSPTAPKRLTGRSQRALETCRSGERRGQETLAEHSCPDRRVQGGNGSAA